MLTPMLAFALPTLGEYLENLVLLGLGILVLVLALAACDFLLDTFPRVYKATSAAQAGGSAARRRPRRRCLKKHRSAVRVAHLSVVASDKSCAREALARHADHASTRTISDLRSVSRSERLQENSYARQR